MVADLSSKSGFFLEVVARHSPLPFPGLLPPFPLIERASNTFSRAGEGAHACVPERRYPDMGGVRSVVRHVMIGNR